jgi:putative serine protease PepD
MLAAGNTPVAATPAPAVGAASSAQTVAEVSTGTIGDIYAKVSPSVVLIDVRSTASARGLGGSSEALGSGIVLDTQGDILTNYHVVAGATSLTVELTDGTQYPATVLGAAAGQDLAVIKITAPADELTPAPLGDSANVAVGDEVIAIGYPYGLGETVTAGIVSGLDRNSESDAQQTFGQQSGESLTGLIQVDAAINPGNSGGALVDSNGDVIGINTMIESPVDGFTGVGLAIPIDQAKAIIAQLEQGHAA